MQLLRQTLFRPDLTKVDAVGDEIRIRLSTSRSTTPSPIAWLSALPPRAQAEQAQRRVSGRIPQYLPRWRDLMVGLLDYQ